jgi:hypothetical protein
MLDHQTVSTLVMAGMAVMATKKPKKKSDSAVLTPQNGNPVVVSILSCCSHVHANHAITDGITCLPLPANR